MHLRCSQQAFAQMLTQMFPIVKQEVFPDARRVLLNAHETALYIEGGLFEVGLQGRLPAQVEQMGQLSVPMTPTLVDYVSSLAPGELVLRRVNEHPSEGASTKGALLEIESGPTSTSRLQSVAHFICPETEGPTLRLLDQWKGLPMGRVASSELIKAFNVCLPVARARSHGEETTSRPELAGVLWHAQGSLLTLAAATTTQLVRSTLPLVEAVPQPCSGLFPAQSLFWLERALPTQEEIDVMLAHEQERTMLLLKTPSMTLSCTAMQRSVPLTWLAACRWRLPLSLCVPARALKKAVSFIQKAQRQAKMHSVITLTTEGETLRLTATWGTGDTIERQVPLAHPAPVFSALVPADQFLHLVRGETADQVELSLGVRASRTYSITVPILRMVAGSTLRQMTILSLESGGTAFKAHQAA